MLLPGKCAERANNSDSYWSALQRTLLFEWASALSPGDLRGFRDINTNGIIGVRCVPTAAFSPPANDYGEGGIKTKTADAGLSSSQSDEDFWCQTHFLGLSHGLVEQLPKWAENHNIDILGHMPE